MTSPESAIDEINREFPDAEAFTSNGMYYAKLAGVVVAAAPSIAELREQLREYFGRPGNAVPAGTRGSRPGA